jgi:hypothetical protein
MQQVQARRAWEGRPGFFRKIWGALKSGARAVMEWKQKPPKPTKQHPKFVNSSSMSLKIGDPSLYALDPASPKPQAFYLNKSCVQRTYHLLPHQETTLNCLIFQPFSRAQKGERTESGGFSHLFIKNNLTEIQAVELRGRGGENVISITAGEGPPSEFAAGGRTASVENRALFINVRELDFLVIPTSEVRGQTDTFVQKPIFARFRIENRGSSEVDISSLGFGRKFLCESQTSDLAKFKLWNCGNLTLSPQQSRDLIIEYVPQNLESEASTELFLIANG